MSTQHTPGPWRATSGGYISSDNGYVPLVTPFRENAHRDKHRNPTPEAMANARLIAAAPQLLEALETVLTARLIEEQGGPMDEYSMTMTDAIDWARPIVCEAKGE